MRFDILTLFPTMFEGPMTESILKKAQEKGLVEIQIHNIRDYATDKHKITDETPYGGGGGMVMKVDPIVRCVEAVRGIDETVPVILTTPQGRVFTQRVAEEYARQYQRMIIICGRYEGVDERVRELVVTDELSIGDYVLTGGELPAMIMIDAISRLMPGVLGDEFGAERDSHATGLLEHPHYTRPAEFRGLGIPDVLLSGHHAEIDKWRRRESIRRTWQRRPDMLENFPFTKDDLKFLKKLQAEQEAQQVQQASDSEKQASSPDSIDHTDLSRKETHE